ncbi:hypothetical protein [Kitasatospora indigofera]|uniref:hypothetical protein n=1 Tax=Kitasatospora indigofera TaxID=67307 RepID=UPI0033A04F9A
MSVWLRGGIVQDAGALHGQQHGGERGGVDALDEQLDLLESKPEAAASALREAVDAESGAAW